VGGEDGKEQKAIPFGQAYFLTVAPDGSVAAWGKNASNQDEFARFTAAGAPIGEPLVDKAREASCATFSADAALAAVGAADGSVRVWDLAKRERVGADWPIHVKRVADLGLTPDKATLVAVDEAGLVKVGDLAKRAVTHSAQAVGGEINGLVMSPSGDRFAVLSNDGEVKAFDLGAKELRSWKLPVPANGAAFTPDGKKLVTANGDGTLYVLELP
jgi:WD40 repeat protein